MLPILFCLSRGKMRNFVGTYQGWIIRGQMTMEGNYVLNNSIVLIAKKVEWRPEHLPIHLICQ